MSKNNKVLVLSDDVAKRRDMVTILEFIGEEQVVDGTDAFELLKSADADSLDDISVAIIDGEDESVVETVASICAAPRVFHFCWLAIRRSRDCPLMTQPE
jgi:sigma-54 specific flagellar transcriptional regulator A